MPRLTIAIGSRATRPLAENTRAPGRPSTRRYDAIPAVMSVPRPCSRCIVTEQGPVEEVFTALVKRDSEAADGNVTDTDVTDAAQAEDAA